MNRSDSFEGAHTGDPEKDLAYERDHAKRGSLILLFSPQDDGMLEREFLFLVQAVNLI